MALTLFRIVNPRLNRNTWYRQVHSFVIAAGDEKEARDIAIANCLDGRPEMENEHNQGLIRAGWREAATCEVVGTAAEHIKAGVVLMDHSGDT